MNQAKSGDTVKVHYTGKLTDGSIFDSSDGAIPLEFTLGSGVVISGFDDAISGMEPGEAKTVTIGCLQAYGPHMDEMIIEVERDSIPEDIELNEGMQLQIMGPDNQALIVTVAEVGEEMVRLDANHPLAGQDLIFDLKLVAIE